jgi:hypothetical protein
MTFAAAVGAFGSSIKTSGMTLLARYRYFFVHLRNAYTLGGLCGGLIVPDHSDVRQQVGRRPALRRII